MRLSDVEKFSINNLWNGVYRSVKEAKSIEEAAQCVVDACFEEFKESVVLTRIFVSIPYGDLPESNRQFAKDFAVKMGNHEELNDQTPVLSLMGTRGVEATWNDRRSSEGHQGIPMISKETVEAIPMIAQMLKDLGLGIEWLSKSHDESVGESRGHTGGVFLVSDAGTSTDSQGRKIISSQDFVENYGVKTVFGNGARFNVHSNGFLVSIFFTRQSLEKSTVRLFNSLLYLFKTVTTPLVDRGRWYS